MSNTQLSKYTKLSQYKEYILLAISGIALLFSWFGWMESSIPFDLAWISILISGIPIVYGAMVALFTRFDIKSGLLVSIALIAAIIIKEYFAAGEIKKYEQSGKTVILVSINNRIVVLVNVADKIKETASHTINNLYKLGIENITLLTGDNKTSDNAIAAKAGIKEVYSEQLPEDKVRVVDNYISKNKVVCMIGDGINDAPALARADIGIAMGVLGSDVALETADIALMSDDISKIPDLLILSKKVFSTIKINIIISMIINIIAVILAATGIIDPVVGALVHNVSSILVVLNSSTLIKFKPKII